MHFFRTYYSQSGLLAELSNSSVPYPIISLDTEDDIIQEQSAQAYNKEIIKEQLETTTLQQLDYNNNTREKKIKLLCWILTGPKNHQTKAKAVKETWGKRCDKLLFISTENGMVILHVNLFSAEICIFSIKIYFCRCIPAYNCN